MDWSFGDVFWSMMIFFFWVVYIWMFISIFADIFRLDISGWAKAGWILLIIVVPFLGILLYVIFRPKMTPQDQRMLFEMQERDRRLSGYSAADEISKLTKLRDDGTITAEEFATLKERALA